MDTLGSVFLTTLWIFALIAYIMIFFFIIGDLFRDSELSGWWKAVWIVLLIIFPFLTALVYLIARGPGMQRRAAAQAEAIKQAQDAYIRHAAGATSPADQIAGAKRLLDQGAISQAEFDAIKAKALA